MADLLRPDNTSRDNIRLFVNSIEDEEIRRLFANHLNEVLTVGRVASSDAAAQESRQRFFKAVQALIDRRLEEVE